MTDSRSPEDEDTTKIGGGRRQYASATLFAADALAQAAKLAEARSVVLVHGAWADGSSWTAVISRLQAAGLHVTALQNPLTSLADSVAARTYGSATQMTSRMQR